MINELFISLFSGFSIGLIGSFHCVGMCGPLALSLPIHHLRSIEKTTSVLLYNIGRALSYSFMGVILGLLGQSFSFLKIQQWLSISAGVLILVVLLTHYFGSFKINILSKFTQKVQLKLGNYLKAEKTLFSFLGMGIVNGFLPCGLVYVALASAFAAGTVLGSGVLMFGFGLGTLPLMAMTMLLGKFISQNTRLKLNKMVPYFIAIVAVLLILRGLNLGIPFVSPAFNYNDNTANSVVNCH